MLPTYDFGVSGATEGSFCELPMSAFQVALVEMLRASLDGAHQWPAGMKTQQACAYLGGISDKCLHNIAKAHGIETTRPGGLWPKAELDRYLASAVVSNS